MNHPKTSKTIKDNSMSEIDKKINQAGIGNITSQIPLDLEITGSDDILEEIEEVQNEPEPFESVQRETESLESSQSKYSSGTWFSHIYNLFKFYTDTKRRK